MAIADPIEATRFHLHDTGASPNFTDPQIQQFLDLETVIDADGCAPDSDDWTPTYDVLNAAGRGWMWLAGLAEAKPLMYKLGDLTIQLDKSFCYNRARELMVHTGGLLRRDEQSEPDVFDRYRSE